MEVEDCVVWLRHRVGDLRESGTTGLLPNHIQNRVDELGTLSIVTLRPIVSCTSLADNSCRA